MTRCPDCREAQEERAAIIEFDANVSRQEAERRAANSRCAKHRERVNYA